MIKRSFKTTESRNSHACGNMGFNLVEIMIALSVAVVAVVSIIGIFPAILNSVRDTDNETKAGLLAQAIFSTLRSGKFDDVDLYGKKINLVTENGIVDFYASLSMQITQTQNPDSVFLIRIKFNNNPTTYTGQSGKLNHVSMIVYWSPASDSVGSPPSPNKNFSSFTGLVANTNTTP